MPNLYKQSERNMRNELLLSDRLEFQAALAPLNLKKTSTQFVNCVILFPFITCARSSTPALNEVVFFYVKF